MILKDNTFLLAEAVQKKLTFFYATLKKGEVKNENLILSFPFAVHENEHKKFIKINLEILKFVFLNFKILY